MRKNHPSWQTLVTVEESLKKLEQHPMLLCWGGKDFCFTKIFYDEWRERFPRAKALYFPKASHYLLEDADTFDEIIPQVTRFLEQLEIKNE